MAAQAATQVAQATQVAVAVAAAAEEVHLTAQAAALVRRQQRSTPAQRDILQTAAQVVEESQNPATAKTPRTRAACSPHLRAQLLSAVTIP